MTSTLVYKYYSIIAAGKRDKTTGKYKPVVTISWRALDGRRECRSFSLPEHCDTFEKASALALKAAKDWADGHLTHVGP
jgi:hypothetical protein